jgi:glycosyltransferase involved in cell wall biosynthesis
LPFHQGILIPNSLDPVRLPDGDPREFRSRFKIPEDRRIILFLGRINWKKGLDILVEGYAALRKEFPDSLLVIAGGDDENYKAAIEEVARKEGVEAEIIFTGELKGPDKAAAYKAADVFVLTSYSENFGMAVVEAMYLGVPVVITNKVGVAPWVDRSESGFVINPDAREIRMALFKVLGNDKASKAMGENGRKVVAAEFSPRAVAERFLAAYNELIHAKGSGYRHRPYL